MAKNLMRDPATASSRIYVGSLSEQATEAQIQDLFSKYGAIRGVLVSKGYGFVQFETDESAQNAIQNENQQMFLNRKLIVRTAQKNSGGSGGGGGGMGGDNNPRNNPNINKSGNFGGNNNSGPSQQSQPLGSSTGFSIPVFGGGSQPPDRMSRWNPSQNRMSLDKSNDNGRDRSPLGDQRGSGSGGPSFGGGRPFPSNDRFRPGQQNQLQSGSGPHRGLPAMQDPQPTPQPQQQLDANDCEIVVTSKHLTEYAEAIERNLKQIGLTVDLLFPNSEVPIGKVLHNISSRGCLYAIIVTPENLDRRSITVNILYGQTEEHRNMPAEDAIDFIEKDYATLRRGRENCDKNVPFHTLKTQSVPSQGFKHPDSVQYLLTLLYENRSLTVLQYDCVIKYLQEQREIQYKVELGGPTADFAPPAGGYGQQQTGNFGGIGPFAGNSRAPMESERHQPPPRNPEVEKEAELQKKILNILNKPPIIGLPADARPNDHDNDRKFDRDPFSAAPSNRNDSQPQILNDPKVQKALDSLFQSNQFKF